jgi:hypothetical protein
MQGSPGYGSQTKQAGQPRPRFCRLPARGGSAHNKEEQSNQMADKSEGTTVTVAVDYLHALRVGLHIDPEVAEFFWTYGQGLDPYGDDPDLPEEYQCVGREYFARSPRDDVWINFGDLPEKTREVLWEKHKPKLAFPAGLEAIFARPRAS